MDIIVFNNDDFGEIRTVEENGKVLFFGSDIAKALGYTNPSKAINEYCSAITKCSIHISGKLQYVNFIPEGDVYRLITHSKLPYAEKFEQWVFDEVLPSIPRHGMYATDELLNNPDLIIKVLTLLKEERAITSYLTVVNQIMHPKADYFDELVARNLLTNIRDTAKELGVKQNKFVAFLLDKGYLYRTKNGKLKPYAAYVGDLFELKEFVNEKTGYTGTQTLVTPKGKETFRQLSI